ncbi:MAG: hypothetical protein CSA84_03345 [Actinomycetales bacterium]|nr:MAG: hypothetical protein CSA84_03345 [Actinomycetales bacterium]
MLTSLRYSTLVNLRSTDALATPSTAAVSLLLAPLLNAGLVTAISFSVNAPELRISAQAAVVASIVATTIAQVASQAAMDRMRKVVADVSPYGLLRMGLWSGKAVVGLISGLATAVFLVLVLTLTGHGDSTLVIAALAAPFVCLPGAIAAAMLSLPRKDPFAFATIATWIIPVTSGTVVSIQQYPNALGFIAHALPGTWTIQGLRHEIPLHSAFVLELVVGITWLLGGGLTLGRAERRYRSGATDVLPM